jgi:ABC-type sugar transport system substrate-binding protein
MIGLAGCSGDGGGGDDSGTTAGDGGTTDTAGGDDSNDEPYDIGYVSFSLNLSLFQAYTLAGEWWGEDNGMNVNVTDGELDASKQARDIQNFINSGVDAIMVSPADSEAIVDPIEDALAENIPVFTTDSTAATDEIGMYTGFDNQLAGQRVGENTVATLEEQNGEPSGQVLELTLQQTSQIGVDRHESFLEVVDEYPDIEVNSLNVGNSQEESATRTYNALQRDVPDLIATHGLNPMLGAVNALERSNNWHKVGDDDHIAISTIDGGPDLNQHVADGYIDAIFDQPIQFFQPIALKFMKDYLDAGQDEEALPAIGDTYEAGDLDISGQTPQDEVGIDIWKEPLWAPGEVREHRVFEGQRWWRLPAVELTPENADNPYYWGNWIRDAPSY